MLIEDARLNSVRVQGGSQEAEPLEEQIQELLPHEKDADLSDNVLKDLIADNGVRGGHHAEDVEVEQDKLVVGLPLQVGMGLGED